MQKIVFKESDSNSEQEPKEEEWNVLKCLTKTEGNTKFYAMEQLEYLNVVTTPQLLVWSWGKSWWNFPIVKTFVIYSI